MEFSIHLNKFEKEKKVIEQHKAGKTITEIAPIVHMSFRDISKRIKQYDKSQQETRKGNNNKIKRKLVPKRCQAYELFLKGKTSVDVAIDLKLDFDNVRKYWTEFLRLRNMKRLYNIFIENEYHLDYLFKIDSFLLRNNIPIEDMNNVLRTAYDITKLYQTHSNIKAEIEKLKQIKNNLQYSQNNQLAPLKPLPKPFNWNYYRQHY